MEGKGRDGEVERGGGGREREREREKKREKIREKERREKERNREYIGFAGWIFCVLQPAVFGGRNRKEWSRKES